MIADVVVAGGGPAGCATALALRARGRSVILIHRPAPPAALGETLPPEATAALHALGVWERFLSAGHQRSAGNDSAWGSPALTRANFIFSPYGCGWHLDRVAFDGMFREAAADAGAMHGAVRIRQAEFADRWRITADDGGGANRTIECAWIVDATGRSASFAAGHGVARTTPDTLSASCLSFHRDPNCGDDADRMTLVETVPAGWWYTSPLPRSRRMVMCFTRPADAPRTPARVLAMLGDTTHTRARLSGYSPDRASMRCALTGSSMLASPSGSGWIAVGDAAATHDPASSFGLTAALASAIRAASAIDAALDGDADAVREYDRVAADEFARYRRTLAHVYALEQRWPESPFWRDRIAAQPMLGLR